MSNGYIIYVTDCETTGLDPEKNDIIEISSCRFRLEDPENVEQKTWFLKATNPQSIDDDALRINKHKREDILHLTKFGQETYKNPSDVVIDFEKWTIEDGVSAMDRVLAGQNIGFDAKMLLSLWKKANSSDTFPFDIQNYNRLIDTKMLAIMIDLCTGQRRRYYNLGTLVKSFGAKKRKAHSASEDVAMTTDVLIKMLNPIKSHIKELFNDCYVDSD